MKHTAVTDRLEDWAVIAGAGAFKAACWVFGRVFVLLGVAPDEKGRDR